MRGARRREAQARLPVDILYVTSGTTAGLRQADEAMRAALARCGVGVVTVTTSFAAPERVRSRIYRSLLTIDLYESFAVRRSTARALARYRPRAIVYATSHAALFRPGTAAGLPTAIRFDTPARLSRVGRRYRWEHLLEQRRFRAAAALLPWGLEVSEAMRRALPASAPVIPLPVPVQRRTPATEREPIAVAYAGSARKKGLEIIVGAWQQAPTGGRRLIITGIDPEEGRRYLAGHGLNEPENAEWPGLISPDEFRSLTTRAELYLSASTYENYGLAQLEALADGALLVAAPSPGPFPALELARELAPALVAEERSADSLGRALRSALELSADARRRYRERAAARVEHHTEAALDERLAADVLPRLLGGD